MSIAGGLLSTNFSGAAVDGKDLELGMAAVMRVFKFWTCCPCRQAVNSSFVNSYRRSECAVLPTWVDVTQSVSNVKRHKIRRNFPVTKLLLRRVL